MLLEPGAEGVNNDLAGVYHDMPKPSTLKRALRWVTSAWVVVPAWTLGSWDRRKGR